MVITRARVIGGRVSRDAASLGSVFSSPRALLAGRPPATTDARFSGAGGGQRGGGRVFVSERQRDGGERQRRRQRQRQRQREGEREREACVGNVCVCEAVCVYVRE